FAAVDGGADLPNAGHQARAVADREGYAVPLLKRGHLQTLFQRAGNRLLGVDVLAGASDLDGERQMLLVGNREDAAGEGTVRQHGLEAADGRNAEVAFKRLALLLRAAVSGDDRQLIGFGRRPRQHLGPAAEPDDPDFHCVYAHSALIIWLPAGAPG